MSYPMIDPKGILVDALKLDMENFQLSNLILQKASSLKAVEQLYNLKSDLLEFAKNPEIGMQELGPAPRPPKTENKTEDEITQATLEYTQLCKMYEAQKQALTMEVPYSDYMMIEQYLVKYYRVLASTPAVKGKRFFAFTKNIEEHQNGPFDFLKRNNNNQQG